MHALILQGDGKYYVSAVFGIYREQKKPKRYAGYNYFYIVWDEQKTKLIKWPEYRPNPSNRIIQQVIDVEFDVSGWQMSKEENTGGVKFLPKEAALAACETGELPDALREKCLAIDREFVFEPYRDVETEKDIEGLLRISGWFHDGYIKEHREEEDGKLYLHFASIWGCDLEVWFWGDLSYDMTSRDPKTEDPYWMDCTLEKRDGFICLIDDECVPAEPKDGYCWFRARHMRYHIIPH